MTNDEAKFILRSYRPGGQDAADPHFGPALAQARQDPALGRWLEREQSLDGAIADRLRQVVPPPHLRDSILAGARASRAPANRRLPWLLAAAVAAVLLAVAALVRVSAPQELPLDRFVELAARDLAVNHRLMPHPEPNRVTLWLERAENRLAAGLPKTPEELRDAGCRSVTFAGVEVFEICFDRIDGYHLYIARRRDIVGPLPEEKRFAVGDGLATVAWADARYVYVLATEAGAEALRRVL
jgi:hypothetical protein